MFLVLLQTIIGFVYTFIAWHQTMNLPLFIMKDLSDHVKVSVSTEFLCQKLDLFTYVLLIYNVLNMFFLCFPRAVT
jgi:hypothetical protein